jgi:organic hydroperoxide reductase OsmC/OhrA
MTYPVHFKVKAHSKSSVEETWNSSAIQSELKTAIPPEFGGPGGGASPEDLYALSLGNCFLATFKVIAAKSKLIYDSIEVEVDLNVDFVDYNEKKKLLMKSAILSISLHQPENAERALRLMQKTPEHCMILNSVKTELTYEYKIK